MQTLVNSGPKALVATTAAGVRSNVKQMKTSSVIVDVAIDQGGCITTIDRVTTHYNPNYVKHRSALFCNNMPGAVPYTNYINPRLDN